MTPAAAGIDYSLLVGILIYLAVLLAIGAAAARRMRGLDDFVLGGRRIGPLAAAISERASGESAWFLLGLPGAAYAAGFAEFWSVIGIAFGIFCSWTFLALPLRRQTERYGALTIPDYFAARFADGGRALRVVSMVIILFFYTLYLAAQFVGGGKLLGAAFGLADLWGILVTAAVVMIYTLLGGFLAVVWTDVVQGIMMAFVALVLPIIAIVKLGGPGELVARLQDAGGGFSLAMDAGQTGRAFVFGVMLGGLSWGLGYLGQPHLLTRYMAIERPRDIRRGTLIAMIWVLIAYWGAAMIGIVGAGWFEQSLADQEQVMPLLARALLPGWIAGLVLAGAIAAMMSTADSQLIVVTSAVVEDLYVKLMGARRDQAALVRISRVVTIAVSAVALGLAFQNTDLIFNLVSYAWSGLGASFGPPLLLSLRWKRTTFPGALAGMLTGAVSNVVWRNVGALDDLLDHKLATFLLALLATWAVSLATGRPARDN
ncbi:MAG: sodium/proline symporter [Candidatus Krumholzibacteria bacterium]|nr:sodium/proline symporter [Candidatus Krumholzibacteria bacterium]